jgi:O-antigen/teichoic acid export membrane protein
MAAGGELESAGRLTHQSTRLLTASMMLLAAPLAALAPDLLRLWMGPDFALHGGLPARLLLIGLVVNTSVYAANAAVLARARPTVLPMLYLAELVLHLACVAIFVRLWGLPGAAAAWVFRAAIDAAAQRILAARALGVSIGPWREFAIPFAALVSVVLFCQVADAAWWARLAVGGAVSAGVAAWLIAPEDLRVVRTALGMGPKLEGV